MLIRAKAGDVTPLGAFGEEGVEVVHEGKFGQLVVLKGTQISSFPIADAIAKTRTVGEDLFGVIRSLQPKK